MINFFVDEAGSFGMRDYLGRRGAELAGRIEIQLYEDVAALETIAATGTIFAGLDQAGPRTRSAASAIYDKLSACHPPVTVLNHPERALRRFSLLRRLFETGCNRFNAIWATDDPADLRYPVFIRCEDRHNGSLTPLLHDRRALDLALANLAFRGLTVSQLLIVEFCDTSDPDGLYRKYSAMRIGDAIIPRHLHASRSWIAKSLTSNADLDERLAREELQYLNEHPHAAWLEQVFTEARIEYGRADYGLYRGEPQLWEINTNPTLGRGAHSDRSTSEAIAAIREPGRLASHRQMLAAFRTLARAEPPQQLQILLSREVRTQLAREARHRRRSLARRSLRRTLRQSALAQTLKRFARPLIARATPLVTRLVRHQRGA